MKKKSTKQIILVCFAVAFFTAILCSGSYYFIYGTRVDIKELNNNFLSEITRQNANFIKKNVELHLDKLAAVSNIIGNEKDFEIDNTVQVLKSENERTSFKRMGYADVNGAAYTTDGRQFDVSERTYFKKAIKGENSVSERLKDTVGGGYINVYAVPLYHNKQINGIIFAINTNEDFTEMLSTRTFGGEGFSYIVKKDGSIVAYPEKLENSSSNLHSLFEDANEKVNANKKVTLSKKETWNKNEGFLTFSWENEEQVGAYSKIGIGEWYTITLVSKSVIATNTDRIVKRNIGIVMFTATVFIIYIALLVLQNSKRKKDLERIAYIDELTGALNFKAFKKEAQRILLAERCHTYIFIKFDVENFKFINDRLGFEVGDKVLRKISDGLRDIVEAGSEVYARDDADEFLVMLMDKNGHLLTEVRETFIELFNQYMGPDFNHFIRFHSGLYVIEENETDIDIIYEKVNYAHRQSKLISEESDIIEFYYNDDVKKEAMKRIHIEEQMVDALKNEEFVVFIQPKYRLDKETISGGEALVRWIQSDGSYRNPQSFIPIFEKNGFIVKLDMYMFEKVCSLIHTWIQNDMPIVSVSVNFSKLHLYNSHFVEELVRISDCFQVPRKYLELELTETIFFENESLIETVLVEAHEAGFTISMDDFGNGYSSLGLLKNINVDVIKMDRNFFLDNKDESRTRIVVEYVMKMAQKLGIQTLAEGIETKAYIDMLKDIGCNYVQGFYYAKPMPVEMFEEMLIDNKEY